MLYIYILFYCRKRLVNERIAIEADYVGRLEKVNLNLTHLSYIYTYHFFVTFFFSILFMYFIDYLLNYLFFSSHVLSGPRHGEIYRKTPPPRQNNNNNNQALRMLHPEYFKY